MQWLVSYDWAEFLRQRFVRIPWTSIAYLIDTQSNLRDQLYVSFDLLAGLHPTVRDSIAEQIVRGLLIIIKQDKDIMRYAPLFISNG